MTEDRIRVLRVLEYEGPRRWVEQSLQRRSVKGEYVCDPGGGPAIIREAILGETPCVIQASQEICNPTYAPYDPGPATIVESVPLTQADAQEDQIGSRPSRTEGQ